MMPAQQIPREFVNVVPVAAAVAAAAVAAVALAVAARSHARCHVFSSGARGEALVCARAPALAPPLKCAAVPLRKRLAPHVQILGESPTACPRPLLPPLHQEAGGGQGRRRK